MHAMAKITTSVALVSVRPPASSANGSTRQRGGCDHDGVASAGALIRILDALAQQAARAEQEHEQHQQVHRASAAAG